MKSRCLFSWAPVLNEQVPVLASAGYDYGLLAVETSTADEGSSEKIGGTGLLHRSPVPLTDYPVTRNGGKQR
jgi:hypothetical protein